MSNEQVPLVAPTEGGFEDEHKKKGRKGYLVYGVVATALCMGFVANSNGIFTPPVANLLRSSTSGCEGWCEGDRNTHSDTILCDPGSFMAGQCSSCGFCQSIDPPDTGDDLYAVCDNVYACDISDAPFGNWADRMKKFNAATHDPNKWTKVSLYAMQETKGGSVRYPPTYSCLYRDDNNGIIDNLPGGRARWGSVSYDEDPDTSIVWDTLIWTKQGGDQIVNLNTDSWDKRTAVGACLQNKKSGKSLFFASYHGSFPNWYLAGHGGIAGRNAEQEKVFQFVETNKAACGGNGLLMGDFNNNGGPPGGANGGEPPYKTSAGWNRQHSGSPLIYDWTYSSPSISDISVVAKVAAAYTGSDHFPLEAKFSLP